jgi:hypothetical protein
MSLRSTTSCSRVALLIALGSLWMSPKVSHAAADCCLFTSPVRACTSDGEVACNDAGGTPRPGRECCSALGMCGPKGEACTGVGIFHGEDDPDLFTSFVNDELSTEPILVRSLESNSFHVVPPGHSATVHFDGSVTGSDTFTVLEANVLVSSTGVAYQVTKSNNMERSMNQGGPWAPIAVNDLLVTCMWYRRDPNNLNNSNLTVKDVASGAELKMPQRGDIFVPGTFHVPEDPHFELVTPFEDLISFNFAAIDIAGELATVSDTRFFKNDGYQTGLRGTWGEAFVPQRAPQACCLPDGSCENLDSIDCENQGGTPQGAGSACTEPRACCLPDDSCEDRAPLCCLDAGGRAHTVDCDELALKGGCDPPIPATSEWGLAVLALVVLIAGTVALRRRTAVA